MHLSGDRGNSHIPYRHYFRNTFQKTPKQVRGDIFHDIALYKKQQSIQILIYRITGYARHSVIIDYPSPNSISMFEQNFHELARLYGEKKDAGLRDVYKDFNLGDKGIFRVTPGMTFLVLDLFPLEDKPVQDERRVYRQDLFGLGIGKGIALGVGPGVIGGNALGLINTGRHLVKTIKWNYEDCKKEKELGKARAEGFCTISKSELRFLILMWRDKRLDPGHLFRRDREFIVRGGPLGALSYKEFLDIMENRGLVVSLQKSGRLYYRAKCSRKEILAALTYRFTSSNDSTESTAIRESIDLITRCTDLATGKVVVPDDRE